jgi:hypothetical protein
VQIEDVSISDVLMVQKEEPQPPWPISILRRPAETEAKSLYFRGRIERRKKRRGWRARVCSAEKHYGHMAPSYIVEAIHAGAPRFATGVFNTTVVPLQKPAGAP